jgi:hypothetical protein
MVVGATLVLSGAARARSLDDFGAEKAAAFDLLHTTAKQAIATAAQDGSLKDFMVSDRDVVRELLKHLSPDESDAEFFTLSREIGEHDALASPIYHSLESEHWVVGYASPVRDDDRLYAVLHFEQSLRKLLDMISARSAPRGIHWYILEDDGWLNVDRARGTSELLDEANETEPIRYSIRFSLGDLSTGELRAIADQTDHGSIDIGRKRHDIALRTVDRRTVVAVSEMRP